MVVATVRVRHLAVTAMSKSTTVHQINEVLDRTPMCSPIVRTACGRTIQAIEMGSSVETDDPSMSVELNDPGDRWGLDPTVWKLCEACQRSS